MKGAVATGHVESTRAAIEILEDGGNAADAILAALTCSGACEPILTSFMGGGFMLWVPKEGEPVIYDFNVQTPLSKRPESEIHFIKESLNFGTETQVYHVGWASIGVPGVLKGVFDVHRDLGSVPIEKIFSPTQRICRAGFIVNDMQDFLYRALAGVIASSQSSKDIHINKHTDDFFKAGESFRNTDYADFLDLLIAEGDRAFYGGDFGTKFAKQIQEEGGFLTEKDFQDYQVIKRKPLISKFRDVELIGCPPPGMTGLSLKLILNILNQLDLSKIKFRSPEYYLFITKLLEISEKAREEDLDGRLMDVDPETFWSSMEDTSKYKNEIKKQLNFLGNTTHMSVVDKEGNIASITSSVGATAGLVAPGTGLLMNGMLGETDLNPNGFHKWENNVRMASAMCPSAVVFENGSRLGFGSAGSSRIRSALLQCFLNIFLHGQTVEEAVCESRIHAELGHISLEGGIHPETEALIKEYGYSVQPWDELNLFFGGVHAAYYSAEKNEFSAASDPRRHGHAAVAAVKKAK